MTATVDNPILLPTSQAIPGGEIVSTDGRQGGLRFVARAQNTQCEQHRGPLVSAASSSGTPILTGTGAVARWRAKLQPKLGYQLEDATAFVDIYVAGAGSVTVEATWTQAGGGSTTVSNTFSAGARALLSIDADNIADDTEYADVTLEITASTVTTVEVYGFELEYIRTGGSLEVLAAQQQGTSEFTPLDDALTESDRPLTPGAMYSAHANARHLYARTGMAMSCAYPEDGTEGAQSFVVPVPEGADTLDVHVYIDADPLKATQAGISVDGFSTTFSISPAVDMWVSVSRPVSGSSASVIYLTQTNSVHNACSAWFDDRDTTVRATKCVIDESGNFLVDENGNNVCEVA